MEMTYVEPQLKLKLTSNFSHGLNLKPYFKISDSTMPATHFKLITLCPE